MSRYITAAQYKKLIEIPRAKLAVRACVFCGAIIEKKGRILLVKVIKSPYPGWGLPGGVLLWNEKVLECTEREILEESGYKVNFKKTLGVYQRKTISSSDVDFFRFVFICSLKTNYQRKIVDPHISEAKWLKIEDILKNKVNVRSQEIVREVKDYASGKSFPLEVLELYKW